MSTPRRTLPHPWDLHIDQCRGTRCVWCNEPLTTSIPAGTVRVVHEHGTFKRLVKFRVNSCPACAKEQP